MIFRSSKILFLLNLSVLLFTTGVQAQPDPARAALQRAAEALGGMDRLQELENFQVTGFGQRYSFNGNLSPDPNSPPKWQSMVDATRTFDLLNRQALNQERNSFQYPLAASFGHTWNPGATLLTGAGLLDHPVPAVLEALAPDTTLGTVSTEDGLTVVNFTLASGEPAAIALDSVSGRPYWSRHIAGDGTLGDVAFTTYFTGYVNYEGIEMPLGIMTRSDWRDQPVYIFQTDSYRLNVDNLPDFPDPAPAAGTPPAPAVNVTELAPGVWDVRIPGFGRGGDGGAVIEFDDHLVMFEPYGSETATLARIDAANGIVPGKQVTHIIVTHHHSDHAAGVRAAVSRGITIIAERENRELYEEWVSRSAVHFPDALARNPQPLRFLPVDDMLVLEDSTQRLEIYQVVGHTHMGNALFAWLPEERFFMEGDLSDVNWEWHWWAWAINANISHYDLDPVLNIPVHGEVLGMDETLESVQAQSEAADEFCGSIRDEGYRFFGCPVRYDVNGLRR